MQNFLGNLFFPLCYPLAQRAARRHQEQKDHELVLQELERQRDAEQRGRILILSLQEDLRGLQRRVNGVVAIPSGTWNMEWQSGDVTLVLKNHTPEFHENLDIIFGTECLCMERICAYIQRGAPVPLPYKCAILTRMAENCTFNIVYSERAMKALEEFL